VADGYYIDGGVAHGCSGAAASLVRYEEDRGNRAVAVEILSTVTSALDRHTTSSRQDPRSRVRLPRFSGPKGVDHAGSAGWCYGEAGVGAAVGLCCVHTAQRDEAAKWLEIAHAGVAHGLLASEHLEPGLCHGVAGLLMISARLFNATEDERFMDVGRQLERRLITVAADPAALVRRIGNGLLEGALGVALALRLAACDRQPDWDSVFCLS
jgi:hypothetical protein